MDNIRQHMLGKKKSLKIKRGKEIIMGLNEEEKSRKTIIIVVIALWSTYPC